MEITKTNKIQVLKDHKKMLEDSLFSVNSQIKKTDDKGAKEKYENKKKDFEDQIKAVDEKLADQKADIKKSLKEADKL